MSKNRRTFLKLSGMAGLGSLLPWSAARGEQSIGSKAPSSCTLIPSETAGPFPLDLTANTFYFRQDVREDRAGVQLNVRLRIIGQGNCLPMQNVRVNIWHCDKDGYYSGYDLASNPGQDGLTYLRGYQMTDANGEVELITIFPGWYSGRVCHIHFQVYVSSSYAAVSQLTFPVAEKQALYAAHSTLYTKGSDPTAIAADNIFSDGYDYQLATLTPNTTTGGYDTYLEVTVLGDGAVGIGHIEKENAKYFLLGQNTPNPHDGQTTVPLELLEPADVTLSLYDLQGQLIHTVRKSNLTAGRHTFPLDITKLKAAGGQLVYQVEVRNAHGVFRDMKRMTGR